MPNGSQWSWKWIAGLVLAGVLIYAVNMSLGIPARVSVLENERTNIWRKLDEISDQLKETKQQLDRIEKKVDRADKK